MNKLVEYLAIHHHPGGNSFKIVPVTEILEGSGLTVEEVHEMVLEAYEAKLVLFSRLRVRGNRWGIDQMIPGDIDHIAVTRKGIEWHKTWKMSKML